MGNKKHPQADTFRGEDFDALNLANHIQPLHPTQKLLGDHVEGALALVGITSDRVEHLLGTDNCGCTERKEKLNQLHRWAKRVIGGKTEKAEQHLESILCEPDTE